MATALYNPTFKQPSVAPPPALGLKSPPRPYVEPLSPRQPRPLEPRFNYPALNDHIDFTVRPENVYTNTPRARAYSVGHNKGSHERTSSTIDTLAEAALAASPTHLPHGHPGLSVHPVNGYNRVSTHRHVHGGNEPPHKRARSEHFPSSFVEQYVSRPATSYEPNQAWAAQPPSVPAYRSRVEEAALLLNLKSGGGPANPGDSFSIPPVPASRPHANSFPQDAFQTRPADVPMQAPYPLLPPFASQELSQANGILPSPQRPVGDVIQRPRFSPITPNEAVDIDMFEITSSDNATSGKQRLSETHASQDEIGSPALSVDATMSEVTTSEVPELPKRRGWPKGKPRGSGARKTLAEKAATKRAASRKKTSESKSSKRKSGIDTTNTPPLPKTRRKSLSDASVFRQRASAETVSVLRERAKSVPRDTLMLIRDASPSKIVRRKATVKPETICAGCETARQATTLHGELDEWISCNGCKQWFHFDCAGFKKAHEVRDVDKFFCAVCESEHGKTTYVRKSTRAHASVDYAELQRGVLKTSEESVEHHYIQPIKDGTFTFDEENFPRMRPEMVTKEFFERSGTFVEPICIPAEWNPRPWLKPCDGDLMEGPNVGGEASEALVDATGEVMDLAPAQFEYDSVPDMGQDKLEMVMPQGLTVRQVCNLVGSDWPIDVIDVKTQNSGAKWTLSRWADYYEEVGDEKAIRNVISLEVSQTKLGRLLQRPKVVRDIDLQDDVWPQEEVDKGKFPKVQFYCLMSVADSYTDFHIDFGGSSVYYHILKGKKTFFFIPPKPKHLKAYEEWNDSPQQNYTFLPSITKECYRVDLSEGDTMLIPSGWIHAVWTPADSLVIGGNFLNRMSYKNQLRVVEIEKANETPMKFRYPFFQKIMWYTAIRYLRDDPLPDEVSRLFHNGHRFEREIPIWADFDGQIAASDARPGAHNARFYSQAEVDGLPDLLNFIFRTVMLVMGRVEGTTADRMRKVNMSIPKGHGEPLEVAKTFALWVAWKRGNEDPPAWAHPDAVLPSSKEEGAPKKLSERKLKDLERKEAIAAWRVAPDRQSARVMKIAKDAAASASTIVSTPENGAMKPLQAQTPVPYQTQPNATAQMRPPAPAPTFIMSSGSSQYLSTPKTSVLGPKRVACDACRKRRIRCKHKDMVMQATPNSRTSMDSDSPAHQPRRPSDVHDNITVTPTKLQEQSNFTDTVMHSQPNGFYTQPQDYDAENVNGTPRINDASTSRTAPIIPMALNGVQMFSDAPKRGRSKACFECKKSKRRCIHDENGNVDPIKASEMPVPRGSIPTKKRTDPDDGGALLVSNKQKSSEEQEMLSQMQGHGVLMPQNILEKHPKHFGPPSQHERISQHQHTDHDQHEQSRIDPNLFSMYPDPRDGRNYNGGEYVYSNIEQAPSLNGGSNSYIVPSLEQIANEVLVDMNGNEYSDQGFVEQHPNGHIDPAIDLPRDGSKAEEAVDSAVSLPSTESMEQHSPDSAITNGAAASDTTDVESRLATALAESITVDGQPLQEGNEHSALESASQPITISKVSLQLPKSGTDSLPLYKPPAALSQSPETTKRLPALLPNGTGFNKGASPTSETPSAKRKRDSTSSTPGPKSGKKVKMEGFGAPDVEGVVAELTEEEKQSLELAKMLQQEELGLRRRSK